MPGARLHYEAFGSGALLLMIPGATGSAGSFHKVAKHLAAHYTVVTYDRRGFSRSQLVGPQEDEHRLEADAADVWRLIEHLSGEPAMIFGGSSGGIVALVTLIYHPAVVRMVIPFEPPAVRLLPDGQCWMDFFFTVYDRYRQAGIEPALEIFRERAFAESERQAMAHVRDAKNDDGVRANVTYWFEHELRQYPAVILDLDALNACAERIVLAVGRESRGYPCYEANAELGKRFGRGMIELPGGHIGYLTHPAEWAQELAMRLKG